MRLLEWLKRKPIPDSELQVKGPQIVNLEQAVDLVQEILASGNDNERLLVFQSAAAGAAEAADKVRQYLLEILVGEQIFIEGMRQEEAVEQIYRQLWGLGELEELYHDPTVDEIRVLSDGSVYVSRRGKNEAVTNIRLSQAQTERIIKRSILHDTGAGLSTSQAILEAVRADGSRLTALCNPAARGYCFALRKHGTVEMTPESLERLGTLDASVWKILSLLVRGRRNMLICGGVNSGKTTLLKMLIGELPENVSIRILDKDNEIRAKQLYPDRDIEEFEDHPEAHAPMKKLFESILRFSPDVIIIGEFRGAGEAQEAIHAGSRGHDGSMATAHFSNPPEAVRGTAMMMIEEGLNLPLDLAMIRVAKAFNIVVQMFADSTRGVKKVVGITELREKDGIITYHDLCKWEPATEDYLGPGRWVIVGIPSPEACAGMKQYGIRDEEIRQVFGYQH